MKTLKILFHIILIFIVNSGAKAQGIDSTRLIQSSKSSGRSLIHFTIPAVLITYGVLAQELSPLKQVDHYIKNDITEDHPHFLNHLDDELQYLPAATVYLLPVLGIKGKNSFVDKTGIFALSNLYLGIAVNVLKSAVHKERPDGSDSNSFPSGHTSTAFAAAAFMDAEYRDRSPYYGLAAYTVATATGTFRMLNNKHWLSDVITGAGVGLLSTKLAYLTYPLIKKTIFGNPKSSVSLMPEYRNGCYGVSFSSGI